MYTQYIGPIDREDLVTSTPLIEKAVRMLQQGQLVAFPTETVYGLGASILNDNAIERLFSVKNRPKERALPIHVASFDQMQFIVADVPKECELLASLYLPGPLTIVLKKKPTLSPRITGGKDTVAVRFSSDPITQRLIQMTGCPVAGPSANISGKPSPTRASHVMEDFNGKIDGIVDGGETELGVESTVLSLENPDAPVILRLGSISPSEIESALKRSVQVHPVALLRKGNSSPHKLRSAVRLFSCWDEMRIYLKLSCPGKRLIMSTDESPLKSGGDHFRLSARNLYEGLRLADREGYAEVLVHCSPMLNQNTLLLGRLKQIART